MKNYALIFTELANEDLFIAKNFYDEQAQNLGAYFIQNLLLDIESLKFYAGIHERKHNYFKMLVKRFPYAVYYDIEDKTVVIHAILDLRQNPLSIEKRLN
jgi:Tfp pilus assembly protein PilF